MKEIFLPYTHTYQRSKTIFIDKTILIYKYRYSETLCRLYFSEHGVGSHPLSTSIFTALTYHPCSSKDTQGSHDRHDCYCDSDSVMHAITTAHPSCPKVSEL